MKYTISTLGCKVNQYETQALESMLQKRGFEAALKDETAELVIVNTCAVTAESGRKSRQMIRKLKAENPEAVVGVCGCYSQLSPEDTEKLGVDVVHGSGDKERFIRDLETAISNRGHIVWNDNPFERREFQELPAGAVSGRTRAMLKIQDGCVNFCTYCIIPYTRGRLRSLPPERCRAMSEGLAAGGYKELVITGIEIASYGRDLTPRCTLADGVEAIAQGCGEMRLRLGSLEPTVITEDFCRRLSDTGKLCDHFHLSLQSGCDEILRRMNRKYNTDQFMESVELLRRYFPRCGLTADLIVGFPGESDEQHRASMDFIKKCALSSMHIFPYSIRPGTKAAEMPNQLPMSVKAERAAQAKKLADQMAENYLNSCVGERFSVLFEHKKDNVSVGHAPNYVQVCVSDGQMHGLVRCVEITGVSGKMLVGKCV